jgi:hypothetical protein
MDEFYEPFTPMEPHSYLFLTLIATVKITNIFEGPLRPKN